MNNHFPVCIGNFIKKGSLLSFAVLLLVACGTGVQPEASSGVVAAEPALSGEASQARNSLRSDEIAVADLPAEARHTLLLIKKGGPFPYARDGSVFGNREGLLPARPSAYYHEYTVKTPGARDRGARRIIAGKDGEHFYTQDHYGTFKRIRE